MNSAIIKTGYTASVVVGLVLWSLAALVTDKKEPWDSESYWTLYYPLSLILSIGLGFAFPERVWRWALTLQLMQIVIMLFTTDSYTLLPLGLIFLAVLALPGILCASLGAVLRRRFG